MCGLSFGELLVIAIVVALVMFVFRRQWLVSLGPARWSRRRRTGREHDDPRIRVKEIGSRRSDDS